MIEPLELRIAPSTTISINPVAKTASWHDFDGDIVTLKWTTGQPAFSASLPSVSPDPDGLIVDEIDLNQPADANDAITVSVKAGPRGDGSVNLGYVNATTVALKSFVAPAASVLEFDCGDNIHAIGTLTVRSYGTVAASSFTTAGGNSIGDLAGSVGSVSIRGDLAYGKLILGAAVSNSIGSVKVGGSLDGRMALSGAAGELKLLAAANSVTIGHSIYGGESSGTGTLLLSGVRVLHIGGNIVGGLNQNAGLVSNGANSPTAVVTIGGSIIGGSGFGAGSFVADSVKTITVGGDLQGGSEAGTGAINITSAIGIAVKGSVIGGDVTMLTGFSPTGAVAVAESLGSLVIGGDLVAGETEGSIGQLGVNGGLFVGGNLGSLAIHGNVQGHNGFRAIITVTGLTTARAGNFNAIGKVTIGGNFEFAVLDAGAPEGIQLGGNLGDAMNSDGGIGSVAIGGDYLHSSILAGINDLDTIGAGRAGPGGNNDTLSAGDPSRHAVLGSVVIKGALEDDTHASGDSGFEAEVITKIIVGGHQIYAHGEGRRFFDPNGFVFADEIVPT